MSTSSFLKISRKNAPQIPCSSPGCAPFSGVQIPSRTSVNKSFRRGDFAITHDSVSFNKTIFAETRSYFTTKDITVQQAADARLARYTTSKKSNPSYTMSPLGDRFSAGESAAYLFVLGDITKQVAPKKYVEYLFGKWTSPYVYE